MKCVVGMGGVGGVVGRHVCLKKSDFFFLYLFFYLFWLIGTLQALSRISSTISKVSFLGIPAISANFTVGLTKSIGITTSVP